MAADGPSRLSPVEFDAATLPPQDRIEQWRARTSTSYELTLPQGVRSEDFSTRTSLWDLKSLLMAVGDYTPMTSARSESLVRSDQYDHYMLRMSLARSGARLDAGGRRIELGARQAVLIDLTRPSTFQSPGGSGMVVFLPRATLDKALPKPLDLHGVVPQGPCAALLVDHLAALSTRLGELTVDEAQGAAAATVSLLAASLFSVPQTVAHARPAIEATLLRQVRRFIEEELSDAELSVQLICSSFRMSRATLYRLFEPLGGVAQYIRERRFMRIHANLVESSRLQRPLAAIAEDYGFKDAAHFSRAFRQHFGYSPRDARSQPIGNPVPPSVFGSHVEAYHAGMRALQR